MNLLDRLQRLEKQKKKEDRKGRVWRKLSREAILEKECSDEIRKAFQDDQKGIG